MIELDVLQMLVRKLIVAYFTSWATVLWLSYPNVVFGGYSWNAARKATYHVVFTERWHKGEENGQFQLIYKVSLGGMAFKDRDGKQPPYWKYRND